jgi:hypothetical protein
LHHTRKNEFESSWIDEETEHAINFSIQLEATTKSLFKNKRKIMIVEKDK